MDFRNFSSAQRWDMVNLLISCINSSSFFDDSSSSKKSRNVICRASQIYAKVSILGVFIPSSISRKELCEIPAKFANLFTVYPRSSRKAVMRVCTSIKSPHSYLYCVSITKENGYTYSYSIENITL